MNTASGAIENARFPRVTQHSRLLPGPERIRANVFFHEPITGLPDGNSTVYDVLRRGRGGARDAAAEYLGEMVNGEFVWKTYGEVMETSLLAGAGIRALGCQTARVGLAGIHSVRYMTALHGLVAFSCTLVPLYHNSKMDDLCAIIDSCSLECVLADTATRAASLLAEVRAGRVKTLTHIVLLHDGTEDVERADGDEAVKLLDWDELLELGRRNPREAEPPKPDDVYVICHTSGTTGRPKGVQSTHRNLLAAVAGAYVQWCEEPHRIQFDRNDVYFSFLSLAHIYEHLMQMFVTFTGGRIGIYSGDVSRLRSEMQLLQPSLVALVPRLLNKFYEAVHAKIAAAGFFTRLVFAIAKWAKLRSLHSGVYRFDTLWDRFVFSKIHGEFGGRLRLMTTGGAPVSAAVKDFSRIAYGCPLFEGYGQTECCAAGTLNLPADCTADHVGGPAPWAQMKLADIPELGYVAADDRGEVCFRGAAVMAGYYGDEELSRRTVDEEGWLHTGDIGQWLPSGALAVIGRRNAFLKLAQGDFVAPEQIEGILAQCELVSQIFVYGRSERSFLIGVVVVNVAELRRSLAPASASISSGEKASLLDDDRLVASSSAHAHVLRELNATGRQHGLTSIELLRAVHLTTEEFSAERGLLTSTLKNRRVQLAAFFQDELDRMYREEKTM